MDEETRQIRCLHSVVEFIILASYLRHLLVLTDFLEVSLPHGRRTSIIYNVEHTFLGRAEGDGITHTERLSGLEPPNQALLLELGDFSSSRHSQ